MRFTPNSRHFKHHKNIKKKISEFDNTCCLGIALKCSFNYTNERHVHRPRTVWNISKITWEKRCFTCAACVCLSSPRRSSWLYLEERSILVPVVVLFAGVLPRNPKNTLLLILPHESRVFSCVHLLYQPLTQLSVTGAPRHRALFIWTHLKTRTYIIQLFSLPNKM